MIKQSYYFIIILLAFLILLSSCQNNIVSKPLNDNLNKSCKTEIKKEIVLGDSMSGLIENNTEITAEYGYYDCNEVKRDDIVLVYYAGSKNLLIKMVKGIPGDKFELKNTGSDKYNILINNEILKNANNEAYIFDKKAYNMLSLYEKDFNNVIPQDTYLILGNKIGGTIDSTKFGLVNKSELKAKVFLDKK